MQPWSQTTREEVPLLVTTVLPMLLDSLVQKVALKQVPQKEGQAEHLPSVVR